MSYDYLYFRCPRPDGSAEQVLSYTKDQVEWAISSILHNKSITDAANIVFATLEAATLEIPILRRRRCGHTARMISLTRPLPSGGQYRVVCDGKEGICWEGPLRKTRQEAIDDWNMEGTQDD